MNWAYSCTRSRLSAILPVKVLGGVISCNKTRQIHLGGATIALLTTPKSGSEVRGVLRKTAKDVPNKLSEVLDDSLDLYASAINYFQLVIEEQAQRIKKAVAAGKLAAAKKREELELGGSSVLPFQHR